MEVETIHTYRYLSKMPAPDDRIGRSPVWRPETIREWLRSRGEQSNVQG